MIPVEDVNGPVKVGRTVLKTELLKIKEQNPDGLLTRIDVVDSARHPDSVLHNEFEWDDAIAGEEYRLIQAGRLIRFIKLYDPNRPDAEPFQRFLSLMPDRKRPGGGYRDATEIMHSEELLAELEITAKKELDAWLRRYQILKDLCDAVREATSKVKTKPIPPQRRRRRR